MGSCHIRLFPDRWLIGLIMPIPIICKRTLNIQRFQNVPICSKSLGRLGQCANPIIIWQKPQYVNHYIIVATTFKILSNCVWSALEAPQCLLRKVDIFLTVIPEVNPNFLKTVSFMSQYNTIQLSLAFP